MPAPNSYEPDDLALSHRYISPRQVFLKAEKVSHLVTHAKSKEFVPAMNSYDTDEAIRKTTKGMCQYYYSYK